MNKQSMESQIGELLRERGWQLAVAESCTGGLVGHILTNVPGASTYFLGGVIAYAYHAKVRLLDVSWESLEEHGAVSQVVVQEMANGVQKHLGGDIALAVSGIAGPGGGTPEKPVGTAWLGVCTGEGRWTKRVQVQGSRLENKQAFASQALLFLKECLNQDE